MLFVCSRHLCTCVALLSMTLSGNAVKLTGTKLACDGGGCGSCTVLISKFHHATGSIVYAYQVLFASVIGHLMTSL